MGLPPVFPGGLQETEPSRLFESWVAERLATGSNAVPTVTVVWPTAPVESWARTVKVRPDGLTAVRTPLVLILSPVAAPWRCQVTGKLFPSLRVVVKVVGVPGKTVGLAGLTVRVAFGALAMTKAGKLKVPRVFSKEPWKSPSAMSKSSPALSETLGARVK